MLLRDMIEFSTSKKKIDFQRLKFLFNQAGWDDKTCDDKRLREMVENSSLIVTVWDKDRMVGFARCTTDQTFNGQINNVVVDSEYRGKRIGERMVRTILRSSPKVTYILRADPENEEFFRKLGFEDASLALIYKRKEEQWMGFAVTRLIMR
jgi:ribosomal protein S18 acetylase RimI-like enzyme